MLVNQLTVELDCLFHSLIKIPESINKPAIASDSLVTPDDQNTAEGKNRKPTIAGKVIAGKNCDTVRTSHHAAQNEMKEKYREVTQ